MAKPSEETPDQAAKQAVADAPGDDEKFSVERLLEQSAEFGLGDAHVLAGALHGVSRKELTVAEAQAAIDKWQKANVTTDPVEEPLST